MLINKNYYKIRLSNIHDEDLLLMHIKKQKNKIETNSENILNFLYFTLEALDNRRNSIDARCNILLIISTTIAVFFVSQLGRDGLLYPNNIFLFVNACCITSEVLMITLSYIFLISPIPRRRKQRKKNTKSLSWFYLIANSTKEEYYADIQNLSDIDIAKELSSQIITISKLLRKRYLRMKYICYFHYFSLLHFAIYVILILIGKE